MSALSVVAALALRPERAEETAARPSQVHIEAPVAPPRPPPRATESWPLPFRPGDREIDVERGTLRLESVTRATLFGGAALGVVPGVVVPRVDVTLARANLVTLPAGGSYLVGPVWRARLGLLGSATVRSGELTTRVGGQSVGLGPCFAPLLDAGGLSLFLCGELSLSVFGVRTKNAAGVTTQDKLVTTGSLGVGSELTYALGRHIHFAAKLGADGAVSRLTAERPDGTEIFRSSWLSGHGMLGVGGHW